jgi:hypothetical protein
MMRKDHLKKKFSNLRRRPQKLEEKKPLKAFLLTPKFLLK